MPHGVACGRFNTALLSAEGRCYVWGPNEMFQCGAGGDAVLRRLTELKVESALVQVELGEFHGVALSAQGTALRWGMEQGPEAPLAPQEGLRDALRLRPLKPDRS